MSNSIHLFKGDRGFLARWHVAALCLALAGCASPPPPPPPPAPPPQASYSGPVLQIEQLDRGVQIVLPSVVLFEVGKSSFDRAAAGPYLDRVADLLQRKTTKRVAVEGHTDSDGSAALNDALSKARAAAVVDAFATRGVLRERMDAAGFSFNRPVASNSTDDGKRMNRRVEIIVLDEKVANLTAGEPAASFQKAWAELKSLVDRGLVKPVEAGKP